MDQLTRCVTQFCKQFRQQKKTIFIAYSGGMDSHVLLHALCAQRHNFPHLNFSAIHVNHQLQTEALDWERHCQQCCDAMQVALQIKRVNATPNPGQSPEEAAREARYSAFSQELSEADVLVTAHHANDQAETFLLQLMRGAGLAGLSAMPAQRLYNSMQLHRPLLTINRACIAEYAEQHNLVWIDDPSNVNTDIRRNYVRHQVVPILEQQWPQPESLINQSALHLAHAMDGLNWFLQRELADVCLASDILDITKLNQYPELVQRHIVRSWYASLGLKSPGADKLAIILTQIINARGDANPQLKWQGSILHRSQQRLILTPDSDRVHSDCWSGETNVTTEAWSLSIQLPAHMDDSLLSIDMDKPDTVIPLNQQQRRLKRYFKEIAMPVLFRAKLPIVYYASEVILIPNVYKHVDYQALTYQFDFSRYKKQPEAAIYDEPLLSVLGIS